MCARLCILLVALVVLTSATLVSAAEPEPQASLVGTALPRGPILALPIGESGLHYSPQRPESLAWGPTAMVAAADGSFWIADAPANRLLMASPPHPDARMPTGMPMRGRVKAE